MNGHRDQAALDDVVRGIRVRGGEAMSILADVSDDAAVGRMVSAIVERFGRVDIVVSIVGIRRMLPFLKITPEVWDDVLRSNLSASF